jgi:hypothetical protein
MRSDPGGRRRSCTLAGVRYSCGPHPPSTAPLPRSATSQEVAVTLGDLGAPRGTINPVVASACPPTAR